MRPYGRLEIGEGDDWILGDGWHAQERAPDGTTFRWAMSPATMRMPLDHAADARLQVRIQAFNYAGAPPQSVTILVNGHALEPRPVPPGWDVIEIDTPSAVWRPGVNRLRFEFSQSARPADVGVG